MTRDRFLHTTWKWANQAEDGVNSSLAGVSKKSVSRESEQVECIKIRADGEGCSQQRASRGGAATFFQRTSPLPLTSLAPGRGGKSSDSKSRASSTTKSAATRGRHPL